MNTRVFQIVVRGGEANSLSVGGGGEDFAGEGGGIFLPGGENLRSDFDDPNFFQS